MTGYDDIIDRPRPVSAGRRRMSAQERAAQFAPFAALTGFGALITETARVTEPRVELDESARAELDARVRLLAEHLQQQPEVAVTYFVPDDRKAGGAYVTARGAVKKIDGYGRRLILSDGRAVGFDDVCAIRGDLFDEL